MKTVRPLAFTLILLTFVSVAISCAAVSSPAPVAALVPTATLSSAQALALSEPFESSPAYWPTLEWRTSTPEAQGMDSTVLANMLDYIREQKINIHSILIVRNGYLVLEAYFYPFGPEVRQEIHSCTKSIASALAGIAIGKGYLKGVNQRVLDLFPERNITNLDERKQAMTVENLLTMSAGLEWIFEPASNQDPATKDSTLQMYESSDWAQYVLDRPMASQPGTKYLYSNGTSHLLAALIQQATGKSPLAFANQNLFRPIGISDVTWPYDPQGVNFGAGALQMTARDMARFGYLYLQDGAWDGQQIIPSDYVKASFVPRITADTGSSYGYLWWISSYGASAQGWGGQAITVMPDRQMVVVVTSGVSDRDAAMAQGMAESMAVSALKSTEPLALNPEGKRELDAVIAKIGQANSKSIAPPPPIAAQISGKTFTLTPNPLDWRSFSFQFDDQQAVVQIQLGNNSLRMPIGLDNAYKFTSDAELPLRPFVIGPVEKRLQNFHWTNNSPAGLKGFWQDEKSFVTTMQILGKADQVTLQFTFEGNSAKIWINQIFGGYSDKFDARF